MQKQVELTVDNQKPHADNAACRKLQKKHNLEIDYDLMI